MKYVLVNYNSDWSWVKSFTDDYIIYDRTEGAREEPHVVLTENRGHCDYDKLNYLVDNYDNLPDVFFWGKANLWKSVDRDVFEKLAKDCFTPLLKDSHREIKSNGTWEYARVHGTDKDISFYKDGMYYELNNSWYLHEYPAKSFSSFSDWAKHFTLENPEYIPFAPGGNYILTRERVHRFSRDFYREMSDFLPYCTLPGEAQMAERSYYLMWK